MSDVDARRESAGGPAWSLEDYRRGYVLLTKGHNPPYDEAILASRLEAREFFEQGLITRGSRVLDTGCGHGRQAIGMMGFGIGTYTGLDVIADSIDFCRQSFAGLPNFAFHHLDVQNAFYNPEGSQAPEVVVFPIADASQDAVVAGSLYTHLGTRAVCERYLDESVRVLKPGGGIFCSWFRSPPNKVTDDQMRTVLPEAVILDMVTRRFHVWYCRGGVDDGYNSQWCLYGRKK